VDATSGDTGNTGRDHKMHQEILESQRYPEIIFTPTRMSARSNLRETRRCRLMALSDCMEATT
jgi:hypothetical protein